MITMVKQSLLNYPAQMLEVASDLHQAPAKYGNPDAYDIHNKQVIRLYGYSQVLHHQLVTLCKNAPDKKVPP